MGTTYYHWDPFDDCVMHETDSVGATIVTYNHEPGKFGPLISESRGGVTFTHHYDALGSTTLMTDGTGTVTDTFTFDAWGNHVSRTGTTGTPYQWLGEWGYHLDTAAGLYYVRARTYFAALARFTARDPLLQRVHHSPMLLDAISQFGPHTPTKWPQGPVNNSYVYSEANPCGLSDPSGLLAKKRILRVVASCDTFTVAQWNTAFCNWAGNAVERRQRCPCSTMRDALVPLTQQDIEASFNGIYDSLINDGIIDAACQVRLANRDQCGLNNGMSFAVTCLNIANQMGPHIICMPRVGISRCDLDGLMLHELVHVIQRCQGGRRRTSCAALKGEAYSYSCTSQVLRKCVAPLEQQGQIKRCVTEGVLNSCDAAGAGAFNELCAGLRRQG